jgi:hypothetical protein
MDNFIGFAFPEGGSVSAGLTLFGVGVGVFWGEMNRRKKSSTTQLGIWEMNFGYL